VGAVLTKPGCGSTATSSLVAGNSRES
jgi:hypothetical protein